MKFFRAPTGKGWAWLVGTAMVVAILLVSAGKPRLGLAILVAPMLVSNQFQLVLTNSSEVSISYAMTKPQFRRGESWDEVMVDLGFHVNTNGQVVPGMVGKVAPGSAITLSGKEPKYIDAPYDVNGWRVGIVCHFDEQTTWEKWRYQLQTKVMGKAPYNLPLLHTNYSSIVPFGTGQADEGKPLLP